jgi:hypothetical protein
MDPFTVANQVHKGATTSPQAHATVTIVEKHWFCSPQRQIQCVTQFHPIKVRSDAFSASNDGETQ